MNICIYHNLKEGGGLFYLSQISKELQKKHSLEVYSFQKNPNPKIFNTYHYKKLKKTKGLLGHLLQINFEMKTKSKVMAKKILRKKFDLIIITNDHLTQSPHILKYLGSRNNCLYISHEPVREYYEKTTYSHRNIKNYISRLIRISTKIIDKSNCKKAKNIIVNSYYSQYIFSKIFKKNSYVIYPGLSRLKISPISCKYRNTLVSFGSLSRIKGHHLSIKYALNNSNNKLIIAGFKNNDMSYLINKFKSKNIKFLVNLSKNEKEEVLEKNKFFFANQINEPFGITTLEIANKNNVTLGLNLGGTPEIIDNGINGFIYPQNDKVANKILKYIDIKKTINLYKNKNISWGEATSNLLRLYHFLKNEPAY